MCDGRRLVALADGRHIDSSSHPLMKDAKWHHSTRDRLEEEPIKPEETTSGGSGSSTEQKKKKPTKKQQKQEALQIRPQQCMKQLIQMVRYVNQRVSEVVVGARRPPQEHHCTNCMAVGHNQRTCTATPPHPHHPPSIPSSSSSKLPHPHASVATTAINS